MELIDELMQILHARLELPLYERAVLKLAISFLDQKGHSYGEENYPWHIRMTREEFEALPGAPWKFINGQPASKAERHAPKKENEPVPRKEGEEENSEDLLSPLWQMHDPNLDYLKQPDMTLAEFDREYPNPESIGGDWFMEEAPVMIRVLRGYRRLLVEKEKRQRES